MTVPLADVTAEIAEFLAALITVYTLIIIAYIVFSLIISFGGGMPGGYRRTTSAVYGFLRDVSEPYLSIFRRFIPPIGPLDLSPILAILVLQIVGGLLVAALR